MTEDYKKTLIEYITNLLNKEEPQPEDFNITNINGIEYSGTEWANIINEFNLYYVAINGILEDERYDTFIMYGGYQKETTETSKGFLIYLDKNGVPIKLIKTNYRGFVYLDYDDSSNRIYGVVCDRSTNITSLDNDAYFVYFNNLFLSEEPILTYSYKIWTNSGTAGDKVFIPRNIVKDPNGSNYLMFGSTYNGLFAPKIIELKINVGTTNELTTWSVDTNYFYYASFGWYTESTPHFKIICLNNPNTSFALIQDNGASVSYTALTCDTTINNNTTNYVRPEFISINQNNIYFVYNARWTTSNIRNNQSCLYKYNGSSIETIYKSPVSQVDSSSATKNMPLLNIVKDTDNTLYLLQYLSDEDENYTNAKLLNLSKHSTITDNDWYNIGSYNCVFKNNIYNQKAFLRRNYNIVNIFTFSGYFRESFGYPSSTIDGFQVNIQNLAPINSYIGNKYIGVDALVPQSSNLYSGELLVFSRNLYNITKQNNQMMASVEVPNTYLNNISINKNNLISKTNVEMNSDNTSWNKNIYEVVDVNFINTITIMDEDTNTKYLDGAIKLNNSITNGGDTNYQNTPCNKYRINYADSTTSINELTWSAIDDTHKETEITLYVDKNMYSIDLISNDESTIYLTIPLEVELNKYYTISQKIKIS